jgi:hypothetical protein
MIRSTFLYFKMMMKFFLFNYERLINYQRIDQLNLPQNNHLSLFIFKINTRTIDTIPNASLILWTILKHMPQMTITLTAPHLSPRHAMRVILQLHNLGLFELVVKRWPSAAAVVFCFRREQGDVAHDAVVNPWRVVFVVLVYNRSG